MGENMWPGSNPAENPIEQPIHDGEQKIEGEIDQQLQELSTGLDGVQKSLESLDQGDNTPERTNALKKIWEKYKEIEGAVNIVLLISGSSTIGQAAHKIFTHSGDNAEITRSLITGVALLAAGIAGSIHELKK
jgi:hypothetical protein